MDIIDIELHDNGKWIDFAPLTLTRPIGNLRMGIFTNDERWKRIAKIAIVGFKTEDYLASKFMRNPDKMEVNACVIPGKSVITMLDRLDGDTRINVKGEWFLGNKNASKSLEFGDAILLQNRWDLFQQNGLAILMDFELITSNGKSQPLSDTNTVIGDPSLIFLEAGAKVEASILNTTNGPIYVGKDAEIMEGCMVRGPLAMCENSALKMGTKMYGPTTLGPHCKVGGEVTNCIFQGYSNKGHDGFLGNSLIGEWCNIGADTNSSNLKNNYGAVKTYSYRTKKVEQTNEQFIGLTMGDHSKCGINTMFNTATVVGVSSNVFGGDFPQKFIPSFNWGPANEPYDLDKAMESANNMMSRRGEKLSAFDEAILRTISANSDL